MADVWRTRSRRIARSTSIALAGALVVPSAMLAWGTFLPDVPYLGTGGSYVFPTFAGPFLVLGLAGATVALIAARLGPHRLGALFAALGLLTALAAAAIIARHAQIAAANGAMVNVFATIVPRWIDDGGPPEATAVYSRVDGEDRHIDIYRPAAGAPEPAPVAIYIHGGGWIEGDRSAQAANLRWLADRGYLVMSADYGLARPERPTWQTASAEVACALTWIALNAQKYGGDPERLFAFGESAGGALMLNAIYAAAASEAPTSCGGTVPRMRAIAAHVPAVDPVTFYQNPDPILGRSARRMVHQYLGGSPVEFPDRARSVSSTTYVTPRAPPTLMMLVENDHLVPVAGALHFIDRAAGAGIRLTVVQFPWADHGSALQFYSVLNQAWLRLMLQHFCRHGGVCESSPDDSRR